MVLNQERQKIIRVFSGQIRLKYSWIAGFPLFRSDIPIHLHMGIIQIVYQSSLVLASSIHIT